MADGLLPEPMAAMRRRYLISALWFAAAVLGGAATLEQLSLDEMIQKSTSIIQGKVTGTTSLVRNSVIYTCYQVQVTQRWKGPDAAQQTVCIAGGSAQGMRQTFPGAPQLAAGQDYVLFLWAGKSGMNQLIGLSQGVFDLKVDSAGQQVASRPAITEMLLNSQGREVTDNGLSIRLRDLSNRIQQQLAAGGKK